jgi:hypothetical protein
MDFLAGSGAGRGDGNAASNSHISAPSNGDPTSKAPIGIGPFGGGLPHKMDAAEVKGFFMPYDSNCLLKDGMNRVVDTYGRMTWCSRKNMKLARKRYQDDFINKIDPAEMGRGERTGT